MKFAPTPTGGRIASGNTPFGRYICEWDRQGQLLHHEMVISEPELQGHDIERERRRAKQGGCCGEPTPE